VKILWVIYFAVGACAEDIQTNLKVELSNIENMKLCSADTILRLQKLLNTEKEIHLNKANMVNELLNSIPHCITSNATPSKSLRSK